MKNILFLTITLLIFNNAKSQTDTIAINNTFNTSQTIYTFNPVRNIYGLRLNGTVFNNENGSLVRIILVDNDSTEYLIFEAYPLIYSDDTINFTNVGEETFYLEAVNAKYIKVELINASINISTLLIDTVYNINIPTLRTQYINGFRQNKIDSINSNLQENNLLWIAANNPIAQMDYNQKKELFGEKYNIEGFEYYYGGIFSFYSHEGTQAKLRSGSLTETFDWRNRHGANSSASPYWDGDPDYHYWPQPAYYETCNGWITSIKDQQAWCPCAKGCFVFGPLGAIESVTNLYFNQHLDYDLSEQDVLSCFSSYHTCYSGGWAFETLEYVKDEGVVNETCFPWNPQISVPNGGPGTPPCSLCVTPDSKIQIPSYSYISDLTDYDEIKETLITGGPLSASLYKPGGHAMTLVGYGKVEEGDTLYANMGWNGYSIVPANSPLIGETFWIFKQSFHTTFGINGYIYMITKEADPSESEFLSIEKINLPIENLYDNSLEVLCQDLDDDGYFWWGIGDKPNTCPIYSSIEPDCDDSDPLVGPYDSDYNCTPICEFDNSWTEITSNTTIEYNQYLTTNIKVKNGYTLKIMSGSTLYIHPSTQIIVENGATLFLDNANIKVCGNSQWEGDLSVELGGELKIENESEIIINN
ncbi:MAG: C1 family peptidase [Bacteroidales bacterium]|nr:C1 family peptidase [Bacteroidales bacterium]